MFGGFSDLIDRVHFHNINKKIFERMLQGKFNYYKFLVLSLNHHEYHGINVSSEYKSENAVLPNCYE